MHVMWKRVFTIRTAAQILAMASIVIIMIDMALFLRYFTVDYFIPPHKYILSLKLALPPTAILLASYGLALVTGTKVGNIPHTVASSLRNRFFQSNLLMGLVVGVGITLTAMLLVVHNHTTPPAYRTLVKDLLGGHNDEFKAITEFVDSITKNDVIFADQLRKVVEVFKYRAAINSGTETIETAKARVFVRSLEANVSESWEVHPLRWHGLAEAYLLYGQSVQSTSSFGNDSRKTEFSVSAALLFQKAIELYEKVSASRDPLVSAELRVSALNNMGNGLYYSSKYEEALVAWRKANSEESGGVRSLSSWGNIVAGLVLLGRHTEAVAEGEGAREWAERTGKAFIESYPYAGILENTGLARLQIGDLDGAVRDLATANAFREDSLTRQNLAIVLALNDQFEEAQLVLRQVAPPVSVENQARLVANGDVTKCVYLIWSVAMPNEAPQILAANILAFLGEAHSGEELKSIGNHELVDIRRRAIERLPNASFPCGSLSEIKKFKEAVLGTRPLSTKE